MISIVQNMQELEWVFLPEHFLACRQTFVGEIHKKKSGFGLSNGRSTQGKQADGARKPGRWSRKAGGRYSQCSFCMKLSVHEKAVVGSRWSLFTVVAKARFYCICNRHKHLSTVLPLDSSYAKSNQDVRQRKHTVCQSCFHTANNRARKKYLQTYLCEIS